MLVAIVCSVISALIMLLAFASIDAHFRLKSVFRRSKVLAFFESSAAWCLGIIFLTGGAGKLIPFPGIMGPVQMESLLEPYGLGLFSRFIAWSELLIGLALLSKQTRAIGAIMMVPMLLNILMVTVSMNWTGTPWVIMIFLSTNVFILAYHYHRWQPLIDVGLRHVTFRLRIRENLNQTVWAIAMLSVALAPFWYAINPYACATIVPLGFLALFASELTSKFCLFPNNDNEPLGSSSESLR